MDKNLIYATEQGEDVGVISNYNLDLAFGKSENDYTLELPLSEHCCLSNYFVYLEGTEYGGVIDSIIPNNKENTVTYAGRTWQGIMANKIICPPDGQDYFTVSGNMYTVITQLLKATELDSIFIVSDESSRVKVSFYQFERYTNLYDGILKMLGVINAKIQFRYSNGKVYIHVNYAYNYAFDEEWDSSQLEYKIKKNYNKVNHLICLGSGQLKNRKVIHLFTDLSGNIQPYAYVDNPVKNDDYIKGTSKQIFKGESDIMECYDYSSASSVENYVLTTGKPSDWEIQYTTYYQKDGDGYKSLSELYSDNFGALESKPSDWEKTYRDYYEKDNEQFIKVKGTATTEYSLLTTAPTDWPTSYTRYYTAKSDGTYENVKSSVTESYRILTEKPADWADNYMSYYTKEYEKEYFYAVYTPDENGVMKYSNATLSEPYTGSKNYILISTRTKSVNYIPIPQQTNVPQWKEDNFYKRTEQNVFPAWSENKYYKCNIKLSAPQWSSDKYYKKEASAPQWRNGIYYRKYVDDYAELVKNGINKLKELRDTDEVDITLDASQEYDVGDIIGARENITGMFVKARITKKILKISNGVAKISYETGE